jgi:hypothetical protein
VTGIASLASKAVPVSSHRDIALAAGSASFAAMLADIVAQRIIDPGLMPLPIRRMRFEPVNQISIKAQGELLF